VKWLTESTTDAFTADIALSLTSRRLVVTSSLSRRLRQYSTTDRQLLRVVELPQYVIGVWHGVETTRGTFVVSHQGTSPDQRLQNAVSELCTSVHFCTWESADTPWILSKIFALTDAASFSLYYSGVVINPQQKTVGAMVPRFCTPCK